MTSESYDLAIIHSQDTTPWTDYILGYLNKEAFHKKILIRKDSELVQLFGVPKTRSEISSAKAVIVIASPLHLHFLIECTKFSYSEFVTDVRRAQLFLCGTEMADFEAPDLEGLPISYRFPNFKDWKKLFHNKHAELLTNAMILMESDNIIANPTVGSKFRGNGSSNGKRRRKKTFEMTPMKVKCEEPTVMTLLFEEATAESDDNVTVVVIFQGVRGGAINIKATWRNPYTYQFLAPDQPAGTYNFTVTANGTEIGTRQLAYFSGDQMTVSADVIQVYIHQMARLCRYIRDVGMMTMEVDVLLSEILDDNHFHSIPTQAFEHLFGVFCRGNAEGTFEFPTLLHLAAKFGLHEFATKLIDLPDAQVAYEIRNAEGKLPEAIAKENGHLELSRLFQDFHVVNETITSVYDTYLPTLPQTRLSDDSENSLTPTAILSSSGSEEIYMDMSRKPPPKVQQTPEESDSENETSYVYMDMELEDIKKYIEQRSKEQQPTGDKKVEQPQKLHGTRQEPGLHQVTRTLMSSDSPVSEDSTDRDIKDISESQKEIIDIISQVKQQKVSIAEAEVLIEGWKFRHNHNRSGSFKEKQAQLSKMRDQILKAKESVKQPSFWSSVVCLLKNSPDNEVKLSAASEDLANLSCHSVTFQPPAQSSLSEYCSVKARTNNICKTTETEKHYPEPNDETAHRNSNVSASSRESTFSVTSRTSTSSGVDIDTVDEEHLSEVEIRFRNPHSLGSDYGARHQFFKRKSRNLEMLKEELTCPEARCPPPLPPRMTPFRYPEKSSFHIDQITTSDPNQQPTPKPLIESVKLPPLPCHQEVPRNRSSSEGSIVFPQSVVQHPPLEKLSWKSLDNPPPVCPRVLRKETMSPTRRRPAPPEPKDGCHQDSPPPEPKDSCHLGWHQQFCEEVKREDYLVEPKSITGRVLGKLPLSSSGKTQMMTQSKENPVYMGGSEGMVRRQATLETLVETKETFSKTCEEVAKRKSDDFTSKVQIEAHMVRRTHTSPRMSSDRYEVQNIRRLYQDRATKKGLQDPVAPAVSAATEERQEMNLVVTNSETSDKASGAIEEEHAARTDFCEKTIYDDLETSMNELKSVLYHLGDVTKESDNHMPDDKSKAVSDNPVCLEDRAFDACTGVMSSNLSGLMARDDKVTKQLDKAQQLPSELSQGADLFQLKSYSTEGGSQTSNFPVLKLAVAKQLSSEPGNLPMQNETKSKTSPDSKIKETTKEEKLNTSQTEMNPRATAMDTIHPKPSKECALGSFSKKPLPDSASTILPVTQDTVVEKPETCLTKSDTPAECHAVCPIERPGSSRSKPPLPQIFKSKQSEHAKVEAVSLERGRSSPDIEPKSPCATKGLGQMTTPVLVIGQPAAKVSETAVTSSKHKTPPPTPRRTFKKNNT